MTTWTRRKDYAIGDDGTSSSSVESGILPDLKRGRVRAVQRVRDRGGLKRDVKTKVPGKIDIGRCFSDNQLEQVGDAANFKPVERELVFDIDMTDYDDVRTCCDAAKICPKCWPLMNCAVKVLDEGLREDFGFEHILWVYSGARDTRGKLRQTGEGNCRTTKEARRNIFPCSKALKAEAKRKNQSEFCERGDGEDAPEVGTGALWKRAETILEEGVFAGAEIDGIEEASRHHFVHDSRRERWSQAEFDFKNDKKPKPSIDGDVDLNTWRWQRIEKNVEKALKTKYGWELARCLQVIIFSHVYPRLDAEVSKHMNHLLKLRRFASIRKPVACASRSIRPSATSSIRFPGRSHRKCATCYKSTKNLAPTKTQSRKPPWVKPWERSRGASF